MFSLFKKSRAKPRGDLYVSVINGENPELFLDIDQAALNDITKQKYVTMRVIVVETGSSQK